MLGGAHVAGVAPVFDPIEHPVIDINGHAFVRVSVAKRQMQVIVK